MKRIAVLMLAAMVCIAALPSCTSKNTDIDNTSMDDEGSQQIPASTVLNTYSLFGTDENGSSQYKALVSEFMADNKAVTIKDKSQSYSETVKSELVTAFEDGEEPDVLFFHTGANASQFATSGTVVPIDEIKAQYSSYACDILPAALQSVKESDSVAYAVPIRGFYEGLFVNTDLFEKYELELPTDWTHFTKAIQTFSEAGITPLAAALNDTPHYVLEQLLLSGGTQDYLTVPKTEGEIPKSWYNAMQVLTSLYNLGAFPKENDSVAEADTTAQFLQKKAAMQIDGSWLASRIEENGGADTTVVLPFPTVGGGKNKKTDIIGGFTSGYYITRKAWNDPLKRPAAVAFVQKMTSADAVSRFYSIGSIPSAKIGQPQTTSALAESAYELCTSPSSLTKPMDTRFSNTAWQYITSHAAAMASGNSDPKEIFAQAVLLNS